MDTKYWQLHIRLGMIGATFLGFLAGRTVIGDKKPLELKRENWNM
jgi:hypothetical protein